MTSSCSRPGLSHSIRLHPHECLSHCPPYSRGCDRAECLPLVFLVGSKAADTLSVSSRLASHRSASCINFPKIHSGNFEGETARYGHLGFHYAGALFLNF